MISQYVAFGDKIDFRVKDCTLNLSKSNQRFVCFFIAALLVYLLGCFSRSGNADFPSHEEKIAQGKTTVLFLGDSLTYGYSLGTDKAYPALIEKAWQQEDLPLRAKNAGINGNTTDDVLNRMDALLTDDIHSVFLAIGINDGLRGADIAKIKQNLITIIQKIRAKEIAVVLAGMRVPLGPNLGYPSNFKAMYKEVVQETKVPYYSFLLKDVVARPRLNLGDGLHPNEKGHQIISKNVAPFIKKHLLK